MNNIDYDANPQEYRAKPGVTQSQLKHLSRSPAHFKYACEHPITPTPAMEFGTLVDHLFFGTPFKWVESAFDDFRSKEAKAWREDQERTGTTVFKPATIAEARAVIDSLMRRNAVKELLQAGSAQVAMYADMEGVHCKGLPDWICSDQALIVDLKTTGKQAAAVFSVGDIDYTDGADFARTIINLGYDVQAAFYLDMFKVITGEDMDWRWIVAEVEPPYEVAVWAATPQIIERGRRIYKQRLATYRACLEAGEWPGYPDKCQFVQLPAWALPK